MKNRNNDINKMGTCYTEYVPDLAKPDIKDIGYLPENGKMGTHSNKHISVNGVKEINIALQMRDAGVEFKTI